VTILACWRDSPGSRWPAPFLPGQPPLTVAPQVRVTTAFWYPKYRSRKHIGRLRLDYGGPLGSGFGTMTW